MDLIFHSIPFPDKARSIPRQALGGLSLLLVVALTFGAARAGALPTDGARDPGFQRAVAVLPKTVQQAERRLQRERPDVRLDRAAQATRRAPAAAFPRIAPDRTDHVAPLREALLDLPPPDRA